MITFTAIGLVSATFIAVALSNMRWWLKAMSALVCLVSLAILLYITSGPATLGSQSTWVNQSPWWELSLFVLMVLGMMCRYMTAAIEERRARLREAPSKRRIPIRLDGWEFSYPLFVSVITFGGVLSALSTDGLNLNNAILSFQTGFFWQTLLASRTPVAQRTVGKADSAAVSCASR